MARLPQAEQQRLAKLGLFDAEDGWGLWTVHLQYHWTQTFPAHSTVHIQHQYTPVEGSELMLVDTLKNVSGHKQPTGDADTVKYALEDMQRLEALCPDPVVAERHDRARWMRAARGMGNMHIRTGLTSS